MTELSNVLISTLKDLAKYPTTYGCTPESAHGMFLAFAAVVLYEALQIPLHEAHKEAIKLVQIVNKDITESDCPMTMLCQEPSEKRVMSYEAFCTRSHKFLELLEARIADKKE